MTDDARRDPAASEAHGSPRACWERRVAAVLKGASFDVLRSSTADGTTIEPLYARASDAQPVPGIRAARPWRISCRVDHPDPEVAARLALADLEQGADGLTLVFSGSRSSRGFGVVPDAATLDASLDGVDLQLIDIRLDGGETAIDAVMGLVKRRNLSPETLAIDFGFDPAGTMASTGAALEGIAEVHKRVREAGFAGRVIRADGRPWHEAGASEAQELGCLLAAGVATLRALDAAGVSVDESRRALSFVSVADCDEFLSIAKFRALRTLWRGVEAACGLPAAPMLLHAETAWRMLTRLDPQTNILRATIAVFAAGTGGADSVAVLPHDLALGLADDLARRIARNTQTVLIEEANLWRVSDPVAGAGGFEALTDGLCEAGWTEFQRIEREGGIAASLAAGQVQARIAAVREARLAAIASGQAIVGTTRFRDPDAPPAVMPVRDTQWRLPSIRLSEAFEA